MLNSLQWGVLVVQGGGPNDFSVSPSPLGTNWVFELVGLGWGWA